MRAVSFTTISIFVLAACSPAIPNSAAETGGRVTTLPAAVPVAARPLDGDAAAAAIAADTVAALGVSGAPATTGAIPELAVEDGAAVSPASISDEQNFAAVAERETIASDAARIAENRAQYVAIQPTDLPPRPDGSGASIVAYALATTNAPGQQLYDRSGFATQARFDNACAKYGGDDQAQEVFLDSGGPKRDRYGMDPDGDGFACYWDPRPFRAARAGAPEVVETYDVVETPGES